MSTRLQARFSYRVAACLAAAFIAAPALAQNGTPIGALGTFDQLALECARGGSDADVEGYRLKLWRAYLASNDASRRESDRDIKNMVAGLRSKMDDDAELRHEYWAARVAIPQAKSLSEAQESEFYKLCEAPKLQGLPDRK